MAPSVARLVWGNSEICTGTVVGDGWVLTADHCFLDVKGHPWQGFIVTVWRGAINNSEYYGSFIAEAPRVLSGVRLPSGKDGGYRDVALLHLDTPMPSWVKTVPMALTWPSVGTALTQYGYGRTSENGVASTTLLKTKDGDLKRVLCPSGVTWSSGHLCAAGAVSAAWQGDSGGPLLWWTSGAWQLLGDFSVYYKTTNNKPGQGYWSSADSATRSWVQATIGQNASVGMIVRDEASGTAWEYQADGYRHWIPDGATYNCLAATRAIWSRPLRTVEAIPDKKGSPATCTTWPPAQVWPEQQGTRGANSFSNPHNASGQGPAVGSYAWVDVSCKVYAPEIQSVNPDGYWYRIHSAPWNDSYYIAANTFWNGDVPGQRPYTHNTDWSVRDC